jgi:flagellar hook assembly protein FlgD
MLYDLPEAGYTRLIIYDLLGRQVQTLVDQPLAAGYYRIQWGGRNAQGQIVGAGIYFYQIQANGFIRTRKMLLVK